VPQDIVRISQAIASGEFFRLPPLVELCTRVKRRGGTLHLLGLIGNGGVHALDEHLVAAVTLPHQHELPVAIHAGSTAETRRRSRASRSCKELVDLLAPYGGQVVVSTVVGRYYAMDRDKRWERTKIAYDAMVHGVGGSSPTRDGDPPRLRSRRDRRVREAARHRRNAAHTGRATAIFCSLPGRPYAQMVRALAVEGLERLRQRMTRASRTRRSRRLRRRGGSPSPGRRRPRPRRAPSRRRRSWCAPALVTVHRVIAATTVDTTT